MEFGKIGIIGCGNMGMAIIKGLIADNITLPEHIVIHDKDAAKIEAVKKKYSVTDAAVGTLINEADLILIAVKPQDFQMLAQQLKGLREGKTIISIMAGVKMSSIAEFIGKNIPVARAMPNMGALIGESMTCVAFNEQVANKDKVVAILSGMGKVAEVEEDQLDAVTALSGSGPAYVFYFIDEMIKSGCRLGLDEMLAKQLAIQTLYSASLIIRYEEDGSLSDLISKVASKGGTTEAALNVFKDKQIGFIINEAMEKARNRSKELSEG